MKRRDWERPKGEKGLVEKKKKKTNEGAGTEKITKKRGRGGFTYKGQQMGKNCPGPRGGGGEKEGIPPGGKKKRDLRGGDKTRIKRGLENSNPPRVEKKGHASHFCGVQRGAFSFWGWEGGEKTGKKENAGPLQKEVYSKKPRLRGGRIRFGKRFTNSTA